MPNIFPTQQNPLGTAVAYPFFNINNNNGPAVQDVLDNIPLLDSVHDFGGSRGNNLAEDSINRSWSAAAMMYSFIKRNSFSNNALIPAAALANVVSSNFSHFSFPGTGQRQYVTNDIENYLMYLAITGHGNADFLYVPINVNDINSLYQAKTTIRDFFLNNNINFARVAQGVEIPPDQGSGKINILVDTPGHLSKVLRCDAIPGLINPNIIDDFAYVLTKESVYDSMRGKPTTLTPLVIDEVYKRNGFIETFNHNNGPAGSPARAYTPGINGPNLYESNFNINLGTMNYNAAAGGRENFSLGATFTDGLNRSAAINIACVLNAYDHVTSVPTISRAVKNIITANNNAGNMTLPPPDIATLAPGGAPVGQFVSDPFDNNFYTRNNNNYNNMDIDFRFTSKRAGDGLQARVCQSSFNNNIQCYKRAVFGANVAGVATNIIYNLRSLVLCTIDRPLFAYAVKHNIPAIFSGENHFILFNPDQNLGMAPIAAPIAAQIAGPLENRGPVAKTSAPKIVQKANTRIIKRGGYIQKGGTIANFWAIIQEIPYIIFRYLPHVLSSLNFNNLIAAAVNVGQSAFFLRAIPDNAVITNYDNQFIYLTDIANNNPNNNANLPNPANFAVGSRPILFFSPNFCFNLLANGNYEYIHNNVNVNNNVNVTILPGNMTGVLFAQYTGVFTRTTLLALNVPIYNIVPFVNIQNQGNEYAGRMNIDNQILQYFINPQDANAGELGGGGGEENSKNILDIYIDFLINDKKRCCDKDNLASNNFTALIGYFCMLSNYEVGLCFDNELYEQHFHEKNGLSVTKNIGMYIMFYFLLNDFVEQKDKIYYGLLEYFINLGTSAYKYIAVSTDLLELIQYVYCDDVRMDEALFRKIEAQIENGEINIDDPIFIATQQYVDELFVRIMTETEKVDDYLEGKTDDAETKDFIQSKLSMYGFLNMTSDFFDKYSKPLVNEEQVVNAAPLVNEEQTNIVNEEQDDLQNKMAELKYNRAEATGYNFNPFNVYGNNMAAAYGGKKTKRMRKNKKRYRKTIKRNKKSNKKHNSKRKNKRSNHKKTRRTR
jgi:hypothetical protein